MQLISPWACLVLGSAGDMVMLEKGLALPSSGYQSSGSQSFHLSGIALGARSLQNMSS